MKTFTTIGEAKTFLNDWAAIMYFGWEQKADCWVYSDAVVGGIDNYHNINITDDFEKGMELLEKLYQCHYELSLRYNSLKITYASSVASSDYLEIIFIHSWSFTLACALYELTENERIEIKETITKESVK